MTQLKLASPLERLDLVLLGMAKQCTATDLCQQAGVSRELFYRMMRNVREAALKALEAGKSGPKPEREPEEEAKRLAKKVEKLIQENAQLRQERSRLKLVLGAAKRIIQRHAWGSDDKKKDSR